MRFCSHDQENIKNQSNETQCEGDAVDVSICNEGQCKVGKELVAEIARLLRQNLNLDDNLFLNRYAQAVTDNGMSINLNSSEEIGYGVWRLTQDDFLQILANIPITKRFEERCKQASSINYY